MRTFGFLILFALTTQAAWCSSLGYVQLGARWDKTDIPVCWEAGGYATEKNWVKEKVAATWSAVSSVRFTGWGDCPQPAVVYHTNYRQNRGETVPPPTVTFPGVRILIKDGGPHTKALGKHIAGVVDGMMFNFTFNNWSNGTGGTSDCRLMRKYCIETIAVHEFGHALGISHEQNRPDTPTPECAEEEQGPDGDAMVGTWDAQSVMNYCNPVWNNRGNLSSGDVETINFLYPFKLGPPRDPSPAMYGQVFSGATTLGWSAADPYFSENITYDVYLGTSNPPTTLVAADISDHSLRVSGLNVYKEYFWRVDVKRTQAYVRESGFSGILWTSLFSTYTQDHTATKTVEKGNVWRFETLPNLVPALSLLTQ